MTFDQKDFDEKLAIAVTEAEKLERFVRFGEWDTAGPDPHPDVVDVVPPPHAEWENGWWSGAIQRPAHPRRIGGPISAFAKVAHSCDMLHEEFDALITAITSKPGAGNAFHFVLGPSPAQGVVQCVPIDRNANHAGGPSHGVFVDDRGERYHPNLVSIGIEFHCAGGVRLVGGKWRLVENGKAHGQPIPMDQVVADPARPGRGWHRLTDYQLESWRRLSAALEPVLAPMPRGLRALSLSQAAPAWAQMPPGRVATHAGLDFARRSDPWPPACEWLRQVSR